MQVGGQEPSSDYPYTGEDGTCKFKAADVVAKISNYQSVRIYNFMYFANLVYIRSPKMRAPSQVLLLLLVLCLFAWMPLAGKITKGIH